MILFFFLWIRKIRLIPFSWQNLSASAHHMTGLLGDNMLSLGFHILRQSMKHKNVPKVLEQCWVWHSHPSHPNISAPNFLGLWILLEYCCSFTFYLPYTWEVSLTPSYSRNLSPTTSKGTKSPWGMSTATSQELPGSHPIIFLLFSANKLTNKQAFAPVPEQAEHLSLKPLCQELRETPFDSDHSLE